MTNKVIIKFPRLIAGRLVSHRELWEYKGKMGKNLENELVMLGPRLQQCMPASMKADAVERM